MRLARLVLLLALALPGVSGIATAETFPPITEKERSLASVPGEPNAAAAFLFRKSELLMMGYGAGGQQASTSRLLVQERVKILTEQGKELGEVARTGNRGWRRPRRRGRPPWSPAGSVGGTPCAGIWRRPPGGMTRPSGSTVRPLKPLRRERLEWATARGSLSPACGRG
jgi:hypothetical protein